MNGEFEIVEMLANIDTFETLCKKENKDGQTPFDISEEKVLNFQMDALGSNNNAERTENTHWKVHDYLENLKE
jgi:hypothetical protein